MSIQVFDVVVVIVLILGFKVGMKAGGNVMLPKFVKWLTTIVGAALGYEWVGLQLHRLAGFTEATAFIVSYCLIAAFVFVTIHLLEGRFEQIIKKSAVFGEIETMGGGVLGLFTYCTILLLTMGILHGDRTSKAEVARQEKANREEYGEAALPPLASVKYYIFDKTNTGKLIRSRLGLVLIKDGSTPVSARQP